MAVPGWFTPPEIKGDPYPNHDFFGFMLGFGGAGWNTLVASTVSRIVQPLLVGSGKFRINSLHETVQVRNAK